MDRLLLAFGFPTYEIGSPLSLAQLNSASRLVSRVLAGWAGLAAVAWLAAWGIPTVVYAPIDELMPLTFTALAASLALTLSLVVGLDRSRLADLTDTDSLARADFALLLEYAQSYPEVHVHIERINAQHRGILAADWHFLRRWVAAQESKIAEGKLRAAGVNLPVVGSPPYE